jgi:ABC-type multidrug transport system ATPase subunit
MALIVSVHQLTKTFSSGLQALKPVSLVIAEVEILARLGPNGAGKTRLISTICGIGQPTSGSVTAGGHDVVRAFRAARNLIGLVPQDIALEPFEKVAKTAPRSASASRVAALWLRSCAARSDASQRRASSRASVGSPVTAKPLSC